MGSFRSDPLGGGDVAATGPDRAARARSWLTMAVGPLIIGVLTLWAIEIVDTVVLGDRLQRNGIHPRAGDGIDGILWAPFLHSGFTHLISNTFPFLVLGGLVAIRGIRYWALITIAAIVLGGGLTWAFAGGGNHIGASGVVFGYFGALIGAAVFERRLKAIGPAMIAILLYSGIWVGLVPTDAGISWEGHLFGAISGLVAAKFLAEPRPAPRRELTDEEIGFDWS